MVIGLFGKWEYNIDKFPLSLLGFGFQSHAIKVFSYILIGQYIYLPFTYYFVLWVNTNGSPDFKFVRRLQRVHEEIMG